MRIGVNVRFLLKDRLEGIGVYTDELISRLVKLFPEHEFYFFFDRKWDDSFIYGKNVHPVKIIPPARHPFLWYAWFEWSLPKALKKNKIDVFISPDGYASLSTEVPQLLTIHDLAFEHFPQQVSWLVSHYYRHYTPKFCRKATKIIAVSENTKQDIVSKYSIPSLKISTVLNGYSYVFQPLNIEDKNISTLNITQGVPYFIYVGAVHPRKNVKSILRAFDVFKINTGLQHRLVLVGRNAWDNDEVETTLNEMEFKQDVIWKEHADRKQIALWIGAAEAMVYPSYFEGFGLPVLEAMACGVPSITTQNSPMHEFAKDSCIAVIPDDVNSIAFAMKKIAQNQDLRKFLSGKCLEYSTGLTWDVAAAKFAVVLSEMISEIKKNV